MLLTLWCTWWTSSCPSTVLSLEPSDSICFWRSTKVESILVCISTKCFSNTVTPLFWVWTSCWNIAVKSGTTGGGAGWGGGGIGGSIVVSGWNLGWSCCWMEHKVWIDVVAVIGDRLDHVDWPHCCFCRRDWNKVACNSCSLCFSHLDSVCSSLPHMGKSPLLESGVALHL